MYTSAITSGLYRLLPSSFQVSQKFQSALANYAKVASHRLPPSSCSIMHETLNKSTEELCLWRINPLEVENWLIIQKNRLLPFAAGGSQEAMPRIRIGEKTYDESELNGKLLFLEGKGPFCPSKSEFLEKTGTHFHGIERVAIQQYVSEEGLSLNINKTLRGELETVDPETKQEYLHRAMLMQSGLNALPDAPGLYRHNLSSKSPEFKRLLDAAENNTPYQPRHFMSMTKKYNDTRMGENCFGDVCCVVDAMNAKDIRDICCTHDNEGELLGSLYNAYKVVKLPGFESRSKTEPWFKLEQLIGS